MVKDCAGPGQLTDPFEKDGVTVMVAMMGAEVLFTAVKTGTFPEPLGASPMAGVSLLQE
jgi:hypothetical protein